MSSETGPDGWSILAILVAGGLLIAAWLLGRRGTKSGASLAGLVTAKATLAILAGIACGAFLYANGSSTLTAAGIILFFPVGLAVAAAIPGAVFLLALALPERWRTVGESTAMRTLGVANGIAGVLAVVSFVVGYALIR